MMSPRARLDRIASYLREDIWKPAREEASGAKAVGARALRVTVLAVRGFFRDGAIHHASALAFDTVLALVPMLAIFFATLKGLGAYQDFIHKTMRPWVLSTFGEAGADSQMGLREAFLHLLSIGEKTELAPLGLLGLVFVLYLVLLLLNTVETVLNHIWGVQRARSIRRKVADYAAILFVAPFGLFLVTALSQWEASILWLGPSVHAVLVELMAILVAGTIFTFLYSVMPHTRVKLRSAALGGLVAAVAWYLVLEGYAFTQIGVSRYNALYSSFAAIPLFLVWVFVSWLVVLFGAEIAAAHHNPTGFLWRVHHHDASPVRKRFLAARLLTLVSHAYMRARPPPTLEWLALKAGVPEQLAKDVLQVYVERGWLAQAIHRDRPAVVPSRDLLGCRLSDVFDVIREAPDDEVFEPALGDEAGQRLAERLQTMDEAMASTDSNVTLRELAEMEAEEEAA